jgi:hypothetical protein
VAAAAAKRRPMPYTVKVYENPDPPKENNRMEVGVLIKQHLDYWVPMLRLDDWNLDVREVDYDKDNNYWARIKTTPWSRSAVMEVVNPVSDPDSKEETAELLLEVSVVHELLHLRYPYEHLGVSYDNKPAWYTYEAATEMTARALVASRRGIERILHE